MFDGLFLKICDINIIEAFQHRIIFFRQISLLPQQKCLSL